MWMIGEKFVIYMSSSSFLLPNSTIIISHHFIKYKYAANNIEICIHVPNYPL